MCWTWKLRKAFFLGQLFHLLTEESLSPPWNLCLPFQLDSLAWNLQGSISMPCSQYGLWFHITILVFMDLSSSFHYWAASILPTEASLQLEERNWCIANTMLSLLFMYYIYEALQIKSIPIYHVFYINIDKK